MARPDVQVTIRKTGKCGRRLGHFDFLPEKSHILDQFGAGKFQLLVFRKTSNNRMVFSGGRTIIVEDGP
jgi:hypothetical protein